MERHRREAYRLERDKMIAKENARRIFQETLRRKRDDADADVMASNVQQDAPFDWAEVNGRIVAERMAASQPDGSVVQTVMMAAMVVTVGFWL